MQVTSETLKEVFGKVGKVASAVVMRDHFGASRGFGFVNYTKAEEADRAIQQFNKVPHRSGTWLVSILPSALWGFSRIQEACLLGDMLFSLMTLGSGCAGAQG